MNSVTITAQRRIQADVADKFQQVRCDLFLNCYQLYALESLNPMGYTLFMVVEETEVYREWINSLKDRAGRARIQVRVDRLVHGNPGQHRDLMAKASTKRSSKLKTKTIPYDVAAQLRTPEEMAAYLDAWLEEFPDDASGIARALGDIARAKGMTQVARDAGLSRESLYKALSADGNPSFATVLKVTRALGVKLHAEAA